MSVKIANKLILAFLWLFFMVMADTLCQHLFHTNSIIALDDRTILVGFFLLILFNNGWSKQLYRITFKTPSAALWNYLFISALYFALALLLTAWIKPYPFALPAWLQAVPKISALQIWWIQWWILGIPLFSSYLASVSSGYRLWQIGLINSLAPLLWEWIPLNHITPLLLQMAGLCAVPILYYVFMNNPWSRWQMIQGFFPTAHMLQKQRNEVPFHRTVIFLFTLLGLVIFSYTQHGLALVVILLPFLISLLYNTLVVRLFLI